MVSIEAVEESIVELEAKDTSFATCERLAWLYIVRDHLRGYDIAPEKKIALTASSDFLKAVNGKNPDKIWPIIDELMEAIMALHPRMYEKALEKIRDT